MKLLIATIGLLASTLSAASTALIQNSDYEIDHQEQIVNAIQEKCNVPATSLVQLSSEARLVKVDQGIFDYDYSTVIQSREYILFVESHYADIDNTGGNTNYSVTGITSPNADCK